MNYSEKLKDPRWQKKRLEILNRDEFSCQSCGDKESTLNVHHFYYHKGKEVWEYEDNELETLCENCHKIITINTDKCINSIRNINKWVERSGDLVNILTELESMNPAQLLNISKIIKTIKMF